jgi:ribosomal-protein-alanine N-acetyltransferase
MQDVERPQLNTDRLCMAACRFRDVDELHAIMSNPAVMKHIGKGALAKKEVSEFVVRSNRNWELTGMGWWSVRLASTNTLIGNICLKEASDIDEIEVGFALDNSVWRQGYALEALTKVLSYGLEDLSLNRIAAIVRPENQASLSLLERCNFVFEKETYHRNRRLMLHVLRT